MTDNNLTGRNRFYSNLDSVARDVEKAANERNNEEMQDKKDKKVKRTDNRPKYK